MLGNSGWEQIQALEAEARRRRQAQLTATRARLALQQRVVQLEEDLAWTRLVASTLMSVCVEKGLLTEDELRTRLRAVETAESEAKRAAAPPPLPPAPVVRRRRFRPRD